MLSQMRTQIQSWWQQTPLPATAATPSFQKWHNFDREKWVPFVSCSAQTPQPSIRHQWAESFRLVSWNVNVDKSLAKPRMSVLLRVVKTTVAADVIFLDVDASAFGGQKFISVTLVSKVWVATQGVQLGGIWRVLLPSRFARDALYCDILFNSSSSTRHDSGRKEARIRLINVDLDSLPINPSLRPSQLALCAEYLRAAGRGIVAGDFNPVLPEDEDLVDNNGLTDAWALLRPKDPGYTWGGAQAFPPNRMDKIALLDLTPEAVSVLETRDVEGSASKAHFSDHFGL